MRENRARDQEPDVMGGPEPDERRTDIMEGADPDQNTDVMDQPQSEQNRPARLPSLSPSR